MNPAHTHCQNCNAELHGEYCSSCGQRDKEVHIPIKEIVSEFIEILPVFDERLLRSMKLFLFKPGKLTFEYLSGRRKTYISPFKLYFIISFVYFLIGSFNMSESKQELREQLMIGDSVQTRTHSDTTVLAIKNPNSGVTFSINNREPIERMFGNKFIDGFKTGQKNPHEFFERIREHLPKILFLLLPVFALLLKLIYVRSKILYIQHLIFSFYFHSFIFFILLFDVLSEIILPKGFHFYGNIILLTIPAYLYLSLVNVYKQSRWKTILKFFMLSISHFFVFILTISIFVVTVILIFYT